MHTKTIFVLYLIFVLGCSGRPKAPLPQKSTPKSVSPEVMMGPPSLLALTEGTIDNQTSSSDEEEKGPRLSLIKKSRSKAIIQLWFKAGVLNEMPNEYGSTIILDEILTKVSSSGSLPLQLKNLGIHYDSWISPDRYVFSFTCTPEQISSTLKLITEYLKTFNDAEILSRIQQDRSTSNLWFKRRLMSRLVLENLKRLSQNQDQLPDSLHVDPQQIRAIDLPTVRSFIDRTMLAENVHITAVGNLDQSELKNTITESFTFNTDQENLELSIPSKPNPKSSQTQTKATLPLVDLEVMDIGRSFIQVAFPIDQLSSEEASYLDLLSFILIGDQHGIIYRQAERSGIDLKSASSASVITDKGTVFVVSVEISSSQTDDAWNILLETFNRLLYQPVSQRNLERAKSIFERETLLIGESLADQARRLGFFSSHWPNTDALNRYGLAAYRVRPSMLFKFTQDRLMSKLPYVLISGKSPTQSNATIWQERMIQQLKQAMTQQRSKNLVGFSQHGENLKLLFQPSQSEGVTSLVATIPLDVSTHSSSLRSSNALALGHWFAALISESIPNEPRFKALFHDEGLTLSTTFPSHLIGEAFNALMKKLRQAPLRTEMQWSNEHIERARKSALIKLSKFDKDPLKKLAFLNQRLSHAFTKWTYPLPKMRQGQLAKLSSSELTRWFSQHIQSATLNIVVSGDVSEKTLGRTLSPLSLNQARMTQDLSLLRRSPSPLTPHLKLNKCRQSTLLTSIDKAWGSLSFPVPNTITAETLLILKSALLYQGQLSDLPGAYRRIIRDVPSKPLMFTIYLESNAKDFNQSWQRLLKDIRDLKEQIQAPDKLQLFKSFSQKFFNQYFSLSSQQAHWLLRAWFLDWHREAVLDQSLLVDKLAAVSNEQVFQAAKKVFDEQQMRRSFLIPPNVQLNSDINCQVVIP